MARLVAELGDILSPFRILLAIFTLILVYLVDRILTLLLQRIAERRIRYATILRRAIPLLSLGLWFLAVLIVTGIFVRSLLALIIIFTVMALVVIFASQQIFRDVVGGIVIALERPFQIGDRIRIGGVSGEVLDIGLRSFQLLSPDGSVVVIPNAEAMHQSIANANPGIRESQVTAELLVPPQIGIDDAKRIAFEAAAASPYVFITEPIEIELEETYNNGSLLKLIVKAHVFDAQYERELKSDIIESARQGFEQRVGSLPR